VIARVVAPLLAIILLVLVVRQIDIDEAVEVITRADLRLLAVTWLIVVLSQGMRALRWRVILEASGSTPVMPVFWANLAGYCGNYVLPARAGEAIRSALASRALARPLGFVLATAMTERIIDVPVLVLSAAAAGLLLEAMPAEVGGALGAMAIAAVAGVLGLTIAPRLLTLGRRILARAPLIAQHAMRIDPHLERLSEGFTALHDGRRLLAFAGFTAVVWSIDILFGQVLAWAMGFTTLSIPLTILLIASLGLSSALPSTPGYVGIYQFVALIVLVPFGLSASQAVAYVVLLQLLAYAVVVPFGVVGMWRLGGGFVTGRNLREITAKD